MTWSKKGMSIEKSKVSCEVRMTLDVIDAAKDARKEAHDGYQDGSQKSGHL